MRLHITHISHYQYQPAVETAQHFLHIKPKRTNNQTLLNHQLKISPTFNELIEFLDYFGNPAHYLSLTSRHDQLQILSESTVQTHPFYEFTPSSMDPLWGMGNNRMQQHMGGDSSSLQSDSSSPWRQMQSMEQFSSLQELAPLPLSEPSITSALNAIAAHEVKDFFTYRASQIYHPASEFLFDSPHINALKIFNDYAQPVLNATSVLESLNALMHRIHTDFVYESKSTDVNTPILDVFHQKRGVCQDFAHIMIACCRAFGLPARYVSGYLLTHPPAGQARLIGSDASHAWASVYLPVLGSNKGYWYDFDPTNNRSGLGSPGDDYVTLAWGRDYSDVSPVRGVIQGGNDHQVDVAVTVMPID